MLENKDNKKNNQNKKRINCLQCVHYYVTWDPKNPRGCRHFNFKTDYFPSLRVFQSSGQECQAFSEKKAHTNREV